MTDARIEMRCPACGSPMGVRVNRATGGEFMGCTNWGGDDGCRHTERVPEYLRLKAAGATMLPGFDA